MGLTIDQVPAVVSGTGNLVSGAFTTTVASEIIIAICSSDGFFGSTGASFTLTDSNSHTWTLIARHNTSQGTCEAWYTVVSSIQTSLTVTAKIDAGNNGDFTSLQVITLSGQDTLPIGATSTKALVSAPVTDSIIATADGSLVFSGVSQGTHPTFTAGTNQTLISHGDEAVNHGAGAYWRQTNTVSSGTNVTMNLSSPTTVSRGDMITFEIKAKGVATGSKTFTVDGTIFATTIQSFTLDGSVHSVNQKTFTTDVIVRATNQRTFTTNGIVKVLNNQQTFSIDGVVEIITTFTFTVDAKVVFKNVPKTFTIDGIIKVLSNTKSFSVDGIIHTQKTFTVDAIIRANTRSFTVDGLVRVTGQTKVFTIDAVIVVTKQFVLNGVRLKDPIAFTKEYLYEYMDYVTLTGKSVRDSGSKKLKYTLELQYLTQAQVNAIDGVVNLNQAVSFIAEGYAFADVNTTVWPYIVARVYDTLGSEYRASLQLELLEKTS